MNNVNMASLSALGGPVGGGMPMMNNGASGGGARATMPMSDSQRSQLNTYIYDYFLRNGMFDCARALHQSESVKVIKDSAGQNGADDGEDPEAKDDMDKQRPADLPQADVPRECPESCFLYEWWCLFWDMFNAQRGKSQSSQVLQYVNHTQAQSRMKQEQQQDLLRNLRTGGNIMPNQAQYQLNMMRQNQQQNGMGMNELQRKAMQNNRNQAPPMMMPQKQQQMQRDPSSGDHQQRAGSPGSAENAPSPSKRPRLDGANFNPQQMPNGRGQPMPQVGDSGPSNAIQAAHMQLANGIESNNLTAQQFPNMPGGGANAQKTQLGAYQAGLVQQQASQMPNRMPNAGGPPNAGSPMMTQGGQDQHAIAGYYNAGEMGQNGNMRGGPAQPPNTGGGNHALQDYQMQLMLLEQQNKKRLMMARQEQDSMTMPGQGRDGGAPGMGPNGQNFQGTSPQGGRSVNSPNPTEQMKRAQHMNAGGVPSPIPEGQQARDSPNNMQFNNMPGMGQMDPNMNPQYFVKPGMDSNMAGMANGMRPPSSHPPNFTGQSNMTPNQLAIARQQQGVGNGNWQGPNGQMMPGQSGAQPGMPQGQGTPQQRPMPPPAAPGAVANGRTQPSSPQQNANAPPTPQQGNKANPKKKADSKDAKAKRTTKKGGTTTGATPSADSAQEPATPTPATPITPVHKQSFTGGPNGAVQQPVTNGQPPAPMNTGTNISLQPDQLQNGFMQDNEPFTFPSGLDFNTNIGNSDVLQDFDFDSFLHQDGGNDEFAFDTTGFLEDGGQIGAE